MSSSSAPVILCAGIAVQDIVFRVEQFPQPGGKCMTNEFIVVSGGCAGEAGCPFRDECAEPGRGIGGGGRTGRGGMGRGVRVGECEAARAGYAGDAVPDRNGVGSADRSGGGSASIS